MTVCIAAICLWEGANIIVGASDRMISATDIQAEPLMSKILSYSPRVICLIADSISSQAAIFNATRAALISLPDPTVKQVADAYSYQHGEYRRQQAERSLLLPLGLNSYSLLRGGLAADRIDKLTEEMRTFRANAQAIIAGVDDDGTAHIYVIGDDSNLICDDFGGFAAIGIGEWHAESEFLFAGYTNKWEFAHTMLLAHRAKKRAEAAPGVGKATDMFLITHSGFINIGDEHVKELDRIYNATEQDKQNANERALKDIAKYVSEIGEGTGGQTGSDPAQGEQTGAADKEGFPEGTEGGEPKN